jgi:hypothetical protein
MNSIQDNIQMMVDEARQVGLKVSVEHRRFDKPTPVRIYADGRIKNFKIHKSFEQGLKGQRSYARSAKAITIVRLKNGKRILSRGVSICGMQDRFNKSVGTVRALANAINNI